MAPDKVINHERRGQLTSQKWKVKSTAYMVKPHFSFLQHDRVLFTGLADQSDISPRQLLRESKDVASASQLQSHQCFAFIVWMVVLSKSL